MIYLYAIIEAAAALPPGPGLEDAPLRIARSSRVAGLYSTHSRIEPKAQPEALWRHEQVVEAAMQAGPTLPVRFGTTFADEDALGEALERDGDHMQQQLRRLGRCVELAVRVGLTYGRESAPRDGRGYLDAKLARRRMQQQIARETLAPLTDLAVRARSEESPSEREVLSASYLVQGDAVDRFADEVRLLADQNPALWLSCTGPWPPYSFVELEGAA